MKKIMVFMLSFVIVGGMLAACTKKVSNTNTTERVLRIASSYGMDDDYFRQQYTELFQFANENIKIEVIPTQDFGGYSNQEDGKTEPRKTPLETMMELMNGPNPPDVVVLGFEQMKTLLNKNLLAPLDAQIKKSKFDTTDFVPLVLDGLKGASEDGQLYALTPTFSSPALIYNKQMFADAGVDLPKDNMTWDEVFDLAKRVAKGEGKERKYGFSFSSQAQGDLFYGMQSYTEPLQLRMYDELGEKMTVDNDQWSNVFTKMNQLEKDKIIPAPQTAQGMEKGMASGPFAYDDFMSGRVAMTLINYGQLQQIINANKNADTIKGYTKIDWDVVTVPSHPEQPGLVSNVSFNNLMAINAKSSNIEDAWKFIEFSNGEKWAQLKSQSVYQLMARKKYLKPKDGTEFHMEAFYNIKQAPVTDDSKLYQDKPNIYTVNEMGNEALKQVIEGKKTVKEALKEWQTKGDMILQKIKENPNAPIDPSLFQSSVSPKG